MGMGERYNRFCNRGELMVMKLAGIVTLVLAALLLYFGYMNAFLPEPPYGEMTRIVGWVQMALGVLLIYAKVRLTGRIL